MCGRAFASSHMTAATSQLKLVVLLWWSSGPNQQKCARCGTKVHSERVQGLIEPLNNRTIDGETGASELAAGWARNQAILGKCQDLEFLTHLTSETLVDRVLCPFEQLGVPRRAVDLRSPELHWWK